MWFVLYRCQLYLKDVQKYELLLAAQKYNAMDTTGSNNKHTMLTIEAADDDGAGKPPGHIMV